MSKLLVMGVLFVLAGLCEIGGGYLVWGWVREHKPVAARRARPGRTRAGERPEPTEMDLAMTQARSVRSSPDVPGVAKWAPNPHRERGRQEPRSYGGPPKPGT